MTLTTIAPVLIAFGLVFDLLTLLYGTIGLIKKQHRSGFPIIGAACYLLAILCSSIWPNEAARLSTSALMITLLTIHLICQTPCFMLARKDRSQ